MKKNVDNNKILLKKKYSDSELENAFLSASIYALIPFTVVIMLLIQLFKLFIMVPYLMATICLIFGFILVLLICLFYILILKSIRYVIDLDYKKVFIEYMLIGFIICIILYLVACFYAIPTFVI